VPRSCALFPLPLLSEILASRRQLFFAVCAMKPLNCGTTFVPLHFGHVGFVFSRSEMVMVSSNGFLHFSHRNS
jgi:hypothetical protein